MEHIKSDYVIGDLLKYCSEHPTEYSRIANMLHEAFNIQSADLDLIITFIVCEYERIYHGKNEKI